MLRNESRRNLGSRSHFLRGECTDGGGHPNATLPRALQPHQRHSMKVVIIPTRHQELINLISFKGILYVYPIYIQTQKLFSHIGQSICLIFLKGWNSQHG